MFAGSQESNSSRDLGVGAKGSTCRVEGHGQGVNFPVFSSLGYTELVVEFSDLQNEVQSGFTKQQHYEKLRARASGFLAQRSRLVVSKGNFCCAQGSGAQVRSAELSAIIQGLD